MLDLNSTARGVLHPGNHELCGKYTPSDFEIATMLKLSSPRIKLLLFTRSIINKAFENPHIFLAAWFENFCKNCIKMVIFKKVKNTKIYYRHP